MPRKLRQLMTDLGKAGFVNRGGKGSHRNFTHPQGLRVTISGARVMMPGIAAKTLAASESLNSYCADKLVKA